MTAQVWKRGSHEPSVTFRCPWCDVIGVSPIHGHTNDRRDVWLLVSCPYFACLRGVLIRVPHASPWSDLETTEDGILLSSDCILPR
jgi:hypothetical protein